MAAFKFHPQHFEKYQYWLFFFKTVYFWIKKGLSQDPVLQIHEHWPK